MNAAACTHCAAGYIPPSQLKVLVKYHRHRPRKYPNAKERIATTDQYGNNETEIKLPTVLSAMA